MKIDRSGALLGSFIDLYNIASSRFAPKERSRTGVHTCPGSDCDSTHSADVGYAEVLPRLFGLEACNFYIALAGEEDRQRVRAYQFQQTPEEVRDRILEAAEYIPADRLGSTDDGGYSPCRDDMSTTRDVAFVKIRSHVPGTEPGSQALGVA